MTELEPRKQLLTVENLSNSYAGKLLLRNVSFGLDEGDILCLLGPSGSGKTTLLRLLAGLDPQYEGSIRFNDQDIRSTPPHQRGFGLMFQEYALFPHKNVEENIAFGLEMQGIASEQQLQRVNKMLDIVGLTGFNERKIDELSGGEQQRVALARSLAPEPRLLLLDEPLGSLDRTLRERLTVEIRAILKKLGLTAVFVTHDQSEALGVADKIAILEKGSLQQFGPPEEIYRFPANIVVAGFLGFSNIFEVIFGNAGNSLQTPFGILPPGAIKPPQLDNSYLLIRPEGGRIDNSSETDREQELVIKGIVKTRRYQGSTYAIELEACSHSLHFDLPLDPPPPEVGEEIRLGITSSAMHLIKKD